MLWESLHSDGYAGDAETINMGKLFALAVATSIDALAVGISLAVLQQNIWISISWIGIITFLLSVLGVLAGKHLGQRMRRSSSIVGGLVLICIGAKILAEHIL